MNRLVYGSSLPYNIRMILRHLKAFLCQLGWLLAFFQGFERIVRKRRSVTIAT